MRDNRKTLGPLSRSSLLAGLSAEIKHQLRYNPALRGENGWKLRGKTVKPYVHLPVFPLLVDDKRETGRSSAYHAERVEEMGLRQELGMDLWGKDEPADTEDFVGTELTDKEREFIGRLLNAASGDKGDRMTDQADKIDLQQRRQNRLRRQRLGGLRKDLLSNDSVKTDVQTGRRSAYPNKYNHDHTF